MKPHDDIAELYEAALDPEASLRLHQIYGATIARAVSILGCELPSGVTERRARMNDIQGALEWLDVEREILEGALLMLKKNPALQMD